MTPWEPPLDGIAAEPYIYTYHGERVYLRNPAANGLLRLDDFAHALARISRYTGHTSHRYSVASHSLMVADLVARSGSILLTVGALCHDMAEAILGDVSSPLKSLLHDYKALQAAWTFELERRLGFALEHSVIKEADRLAYAIERRDLCPHWPAAREGVVSIPPNAPHCTTYVGKPRMVTDWWMHRALAGGLPERF